MMDFIDEVLFTKEDLGVINKRLGMEISEDYKDKNLLMISILKGSVIFISDLMREITIPCSVDFMVASSYTGTQGGTGTVNILKDINISIKDYDVLIVEDILESGHTLSCIFNMLKLRNPRSLKICTLLDKPNSRKTDIQADYVGTEIPNKFVIGYGLDYNEKYRNLPFIGVLSSRYV